MHKVGEFLGEIAQKKAIEPKPFGAGFTPEQAAQAVKLEVWGSEFEEPGGDYCEFRLINQKGVTFMMSRVEGF